MCIGVESVSIFLVVVVGVEGENYWGIWLFFLQLIELKYLYFVDFVIFVIINGILLKMDSVWYNGQWFEFFKDFRDKWDKNQVIKFNVEYFKMCMYDDVVKENY